MSLATISLFLSTCVQIMPLPQGQPAPCNGILWTVEASKKALHCSQVAIPNCQAEKTSLSRLLDEHLITHGEQIDAMDKQILAQELEIKDLKKADPWYTSSKLWVPVSFAVGISVGVILGDL